MKRNTVKYKIGYIDENPQDVADFLLYFEDFPDFRVKSLDLVDDMDTMISEIIENKIEAVIIDYRLQEGNAKVSFNGDVLFNKIKETLLNYPVIILTAKVSNAEKEDIDPDKIYDKEMIIPGDEKLVKRLRKHIDNYKKDLKDKEDKIIKLIAKKQKEGLQFNEEDELIELDNYLEKSLYQKNLVPEDLKHSSNADKLDELINTANDLLTKLEQNADSKHNEKK